MEHMNGLLHETEATNAVLMEQITVCIFAHMQRQGAQYFFTFLQIYSMLLDFTQLAVCTFQIYLILYWLKSDNINHMIYRVQEKANINFHESLFHLLDWV